MSNFTFKTNAVRTVSSPSQKGVTTYFTYVNFRDLPNDLPLDVNPRKPKMNTSVAKSIVNAVKSPETDFDINNRGIVIVAKKIKFNSTNNSIFLDLGDDTLKYGILDGGHTYKAILDGRNDLSEKINKFVKLEIIVGEDLTVSRIADARNTSASVSDIALYELDNQFGFIKNAVKGQVYENNIAIKDNSKERLPIIELLKLLFTYNIYKFKDSNEMPTQAYSSKAMVFKDIKNDLDNGTEYYYKLSSLLPNLVDLYDYIELNFREKYIEYNPSGKFGSLRGVEKTKEGKSFKTLFLENKTNYKIASGYILPVFGAFRVLIYFKDEKFHWKIDPKLMWEKIGAALIKNTLESSRNNPQDAGKNPSIWSNNYSKVENEMFRQIIENKDL